jgi:hypothetical protein
MGEHFDAFERYLRLALKAQNQCRATLETLAAIKNPPVVFTKQANINHGNGNQQINNGTLASDVLDNIHPHAEKSKKSAKRTIRGATWQQDSGHQSNGQSKQS